MTQKNRVFGTSLVGGYGVGIKMEAYITVLVTHRRSQELSGAIDGFSHVKVSGERSAVHGTKMKKEVRAKRLEESNDIEVDANFFRNKIVCVWDDVVTTGTSFCAYAAQLERVGAHVTNGIFLGKTSYRYVPTY